MLPDCEVCKKEKAIALIIGSIGFDSEARDIALRDIALREFERIHKKVGLLEEYYFEEDKRGKLMWFLVIYNFHGTDDQYKEMFKRLMNGEKNIRVKGYIRDMEMNLGYGKYLATRVLKNTKQYVLYDVNYIKGNYNRSTSYDIYHEKWIGLGEWAKQFISIGDIPHYFKGSLHIGINCLKDYISHIIR